MSLDLSTEEAALVKEQSLSEVDLQNVTYFDVVSGEEKVISRDFEAYLVLQTSDQKQKALKWIKRSGEIQDRKKERDDIIDIALQRDRDDSNAVLELYDARLKEFDEFKISFQSQGKRVERFIDVPEVSAFVNSIGRAVEETLVGRDRCFQNCVMDDLMIERHQIGKVGDSQSKEVKSWQNPLSQYDGQEGGSIINANEVADSEASSRSQRGS